MFSAETIGIMLGLSLALGIFSFKTAVGEYYFFSISESKIRSVLFLAGTWCVYGILFFASFRILKHFDLFRLAENSIDFLKTGTALHLLLCIGLIIWGIKLLCRRDGEALDKTEKKAWLLLAVPCPVCASAIFLVCAFARMLIPETAERFCWLVPAFFFFVNLLFLFLLWGLGSVFRIRPLELTGRMMILIALYFILILLIAPQFQNIGKLFAVAESNRTAFDFSWEMISVLLLTGTAFITGFLLNFLSRKGR